MRLGPVLMALALLTAVVAYFAISARRTKIPRRELLCHVTGGNQEVTWAIPQGSHFNLVIGVEPSNRLGNTNLHGTISVKVRTNVVTAFAFSTESATRANWLSAAGLDAYILTKPIRQKSIKLDDYFTDGSEATITIICDTQPLSATSLWVTYLY